MGMFDQAPNQQQQSQPMDEAFRQQNYDDHDPFNQIGGSTPSQQGVYPIPGVYPVLFLDSMKIIKSRKGDTLFIAEFDICQSEVPTRPVGTRMSWIVNFRHDASPGNVKMFMAALMGITVDEVDAEGAKFACSDKNPCRGKLIRLEASETITKSGNPFTVCKWHTLPEEMQNRAAEIRAEAGFQPF